jgi:4-carboxymuconolactone decarboxylase
MTQKSAAATAAKGAEPAPTQRFSPLTQEQMTPDQLAVPSIAKSLEAGTYNPSGFDALMLRNPGLQDAITAAVAKVYPLVAQFYGSDPATAPKIPQGYVEIGILLLSHHWDFPAMFGSHGPMAVKSGVAQAAVDALAKGEAPKGLPADQQAVYDFCAELIRDHAVHDATFEAVRRHLSERDVVDLVSSLGLYTNSLMIMKVAKSHVH